MILELKLRVTYRDQGVSEAELRENLEYMVKHAFGDGWITGETPATVEEHSVEITNVTGEKT